MSEAVEFDVPDAGAPNLGEGGDSPADQVAAQQATQLVVQPGWTQDEAAQVVGGAVANLTVILYAMRWHAPPPMEIVPAIAGDPKTEFPLMGMGLAPVLDFLAPKGSPQAVGVSLTAGVSEIVSAIARRSAVLEVPPKRDETQPRPAPTAAPAPAAAPDEGGYRFKGKDLEVLRPGSDAFAGLGVQGL